MNFSKLVTLVLFFGIASQNAYSKMEHSPGDTLSDLREVASERKSQEEPVYFRWVGVVRGTKGYHTTDHNHALNFVRKSDGEDFDIVDSPELEELHHKTERNLLVEIEARKTPRFLFWGGNLVVKNFKVLEELQRVAHRKPVQRPPHERGGR